MIRNVFRRFIYTRRARRKNVKKLDSPSIPQIREVWMGGKHGRMVTVESLPVGRYIDIIPSLQRIPIAIFKSFQYTDTPVDFFMAAFDYAKDELILIIEEVSGLDADFIEDNVSLAELIRFLKALHEVNEIAYCAGEIKEWIGGMTWKAAPTAPGSLD